MDGKSHLLFKNISFQRSIFSKLVRDERNKKKLFIYVYVNIWFNAPKATMSPNQDLQLIKTLINYERIDRNITKISLSKFINHLWYLNPEQVAFAFFDKTFDKKMKLNMAAKLLSFEQTNNMI